MSSIKSIYERNVEVLRNLEKKLVNIAKQFTSLIETTGKEEAINYLNQELAKFEQEFEELYNNAYTIMDTKIKMKFLGEEDEKFLRLWEEMGNETRTMLKEFKQKQMELMRLPNVKEFILNLEKSQMFKNVTFEYISKHVGVSEEEVEEVIIDMLKEKEIIGQIDLINKCFTFSFAEAPEIAQAPLQESKEMDVPIPIEKVPLESSETSTEEEIVFLDVSAPPPSETRELDEAFLEAPPSDIEDLEEDSEEIIISEPGETEKEEIPPEKIRKIVSIPSESELEQLSSKIEPISKTQQKPRKRISIIERIAQKLNIYESFTVDDKSPTVDSSEKKESIKAGEAQTDSITEVSDEVVSPEIDISEKKEIPSKDAEIEPMEQIETIESKEEEKTEMGPNHVLEKAKSIDETIEPATEEEKLETEKLSIEEQIELVDRMQSKKIEEKMDESGEFKQVQEEMEEIEEIPLLDTNLPPPSMVKDDEIIEEFLEAPPPIEPSDQEVSLDEFEAAPPTIEEEIATPEEGKVEVDTSALLEIIGKKETDQEKSEVEFAECPYCKKMIKRDSLICAYCNNKLEKCIICENWLDDKTVKCPYCYVYIHKEEFYKYVRDHGKCPKCGEELTETDLEFSELI
ncbi:MAG: PCI domain-containing protein [Candidatus Helarchaeota archaeon]